MKMLGRQLGAARRAAGLSQPALAAALNVNDETDRVDRTGPTAAEVGHRREV
ncbi:hypothetical protein ACFYMX_18965 [Streptomyces griseofuscus]|uniref:hypothetical protein n=1 Tax=Streptomyces griseofuscus TaxID=146922 RepID=UPI0036BA56AA